MAGFRGWGWRGPGPPLGIPFALNDQSPQAQGLVAWWPTLGSAGANVLRDFGGRGLQGTFKGAGEPMWVGDAQFGVTLSFDGVDDYVNLGTSLNSKLVRSTRFSITGWFKTAATVQGYIVCNADLQNPYIGLEIGLLAAGTFIFWINQNATKLARKTTVITVNNNTWWHFAVTYDGTGGASGMLIYLNGSNVATTTSYDNMNADGVSITDLQIGARGGISSPFKGTIADARIYNRALSAAEVWQQWAPETRYDLYRPLVRRVRHVPIAVGWPRISPQLATITPQGPRVGGIYVD